jgi:hypothetical protein
MTRLRSGNWLTGLPIQSHVRSAHCLLISRYQKKNESDESGSTVFGLKKDRAMNYRKLGIVAFTTSAYSRRATDFPSLLSLHWAGAGLP